MNEEEVKNNDQENSSWSSEIKNFLIETFKFTLIALVIVIPFRIFIAQPFIVNGSSMSPTFESGEYLIVDQISLRFKELERGDVIVFRYPNNLNKFFIKRVIGLPEDEIEIIGNKINIKDKDGAEFTFEEPYVEYIQNDNLSIILSDSEYFVLGDNRSHSSDSRSWGPLSKDLVIGKPIIRLLPPKRMNIFPGDFEIKKEVI